jgi:hypothetical protein
VTVYVDLPPVAEEPQAPRPPRRPWSRRRKVVVATASALAALLVAAVISAVVYARTYQPLSPGSYGRYVGTNAVTATDGVEMTRIVMTGPPGSITRVQYSISNDGPRDVRLLGLGSEYPDDVSAQWAPETGSDGSVGGSLSDARPFPVTLRAHHELTLWISVTKPSCSRGEGREILSLPIRWSSMGVKHVYDYPLESESQLPIALCVPEPRKVNGIR